MAYPKLHDESDSEDANNDEHVPPSIAAPNRDTEPPARDPLRQFAVDLVEKAAQGKIDPLVGRETRTEADYPGPLQAEKK